MNASRLSAKLLEAGQLSDTRPEGLERYFFEQLGIVPHIDAIYLGRPNGDFLFVKRSGRRQGSAYVVKRIRHEGGQRHVSVTWRARDFRPTGLENDPSDRYDPRTRPWYAGVVKSDRVFWTEPYVFFTSGRPGLTVAAPVHGPDGQLAGIVGVDIELGALSRFLASQEISESGAAMIIHRNGNVIAYPREGKLSRNEAAGRLRLARLDELDPVTSDAAAALKKRGVPLDALSETIFSRFRSDGEWYRVALTPFLDGHRWPWEMIVYAPEVSFAGSIREGQQQSLVLAIVIGVVITGLAFLLGPRFMRPLERLEREAGQDPLTGLLNRRRFAVLIDRMLAGTERAGRTLSAIMIDIDNFKALNDGFGHPVGDEILTAIAGRLESGLSHSDLLARFGGDEFGIILPDTELFQARAVAHRLNRIIFTPPIATAKGPISVSISLGVAATDGDALSVGDTLARADEALLEAKRRGRNRVVALQPPSPAPAVSA